jgi:prevent-host-death family protein
MEGYMQATMKDLRYKTGDIIKAIERGEEVIITYYGKPKAKIVPLTDRKGRRNVLKTHSAFGIWKDNDRVKDVDGFVRSVRRGRYR